MIEEKVIIEDLQGSVTIKSAPVNQNGKKVYLESYGCAMNFSDSEIVASILTKEGYETINKPEKADLVFILPFVSSIFHIL